jgi:dCTP deaminase
VKLNRDQIFGAMKEGLPWKDRLVVDPFMMRNVIQEISSASIDLHLGNRFGIRSRKMKFDNVNFDHDPFIDFDIKPSDSYVANGETVAVYPGQLILGTTLEWIKLPSSLTANIQVRSSWARRGLVVSNAPTIHPGSSGNLNLELANCSDQIIFLRPGFAVCQIFLSPLFGAHSKADSIDGYEDQESKSNTKDPKFCGLTKGGLREYRASSMEKILAERKKSSSSQTPA